ncbi:hypothetical protein C2S51_027800 [Perilla frutescens var. frutescens]|nr:hypothetical protein C2S51_027800 [Perilla frutescens var. frutescens]
MVPSAFQEKRLVSPSVVAEVASSITRLPVKYFQPPFNMRPTAPKDLKTRLMMKLINLDREIHQITHALSKQKSSRGPFGSFLMLGCHGCGRTALAKAIAAEIFDDKDRFLKLDMSRYMEPDSLSRLVAHLKSDKKHGTVVMFDNVENAPWSNEAFFSILRNGRLIDERGVGVDFSHDILLVSSHIGCEDFVDCSCLRDIMQNRSLPDILKEPPVFHKTCYLHSFYNKVRDYFKLELMNLFDDMVPFRRLRPVDHLTICRLQIRDAAASMGIWLKKKVILYPSHAAVQNITGATDIIKRGAHGYETWPEVYMYPMLDGDTLKNEESDDIFIYIDVFMGQRKQYSLRTETSKYLGKNLDFKSSKQNLWKLRNRYRRAKKEVDNIYSLQTSCFRLSELICNKAEIDVDSVVIESKKVVSLIDDILLNDIIEPELIHVDDFVGRLKCLPRSTRAQTWRLQSLSEVGDKATQVILGNGSNKSGHLPTSFLCLGLTLPSVKKLLESLAQTLLMDDGKKLLIEIDLSQCTGPEQFLWNMHNVETQSVIVCYQRETANISVFSSLLSILEDGIFVDQSGSITDFQNSVFVIVSNLGSKKVIGWLTGNYGQTQTEGHTSPVQVGSEAGIQEVRGGLRSEILNRLDHLLLFDPFSDDQLNAFTMLALKSMNDESCAGLYIVFQYLFGAVINKWMNRSPAVDTQLLLEAAAGKDGIVRYNCSLPFSH